MTDPPGPSRLRAGALTRRAGGRRRAQRRASVPAITEPGQFARCHRVHQQGAGASFTLLKEGNVLFRPAKAGYLHPPPPPPWCQKILPPPQSVSLERFGRGHHNLFVVYCFDAAAAHETNERLTHERLTHGERRRRSLCMHPQTDMRRQTHTQTKAEACQKASFLTLLRESERNRVRTRTRVR